MGAKKEGTILWSNEQVAQWHLRWKDYLADTSVVALHRDIDQRRRAVQIEMVQSLQSFLDETLTVKELNTIFQQKTHDNQNVFNLRGMSGGMFFNKLVKYIPNDERLACQLRSILTVPRDAREGQRRMASFTRFLEGLITQQTNKREHLQPARIPFFLSAWWHLQDNKRWPIFYPLVQTVIHSEAHSLISSHDVIEDYFTFRTQFLALAKALDLSLWEVEHLTTWYGKRHFLEDTSKKLQKRSSLLKRKIPINSGEDNHVSSHASQLVGDTLADEEEQFQRYERERHTHIQWLLAKIGHKIGCSVWIAINDHQKIWNNERLGDMSLSSLPQFTDSAFQHIIRRIDVLWLLQETVVAAYEIEHTTDIATGLLRLYDLSALCSQAGHLCIVAPQERFRRIKFELSRPSLHRNEMRETCGLIAEELLLKHEEHILRWAGSLSVIEQMLSSTP